MIKITKKREPRKLLEYRRLPGASYENMDGHLKHITYTSNGYIKSSNPIIDRDLNTYLNLNCEAISLPETRKQVLNALIQDIRKHHPTGDIKQYCQRKLNQINNMDDIKIPFSGILIWWLEKHAKG